MTNPLHQGSDKRSNEAVEGDRVVVAWLAPVHQQDRQVRRFSLAVAADIHEAEVAQVARVPTCEQRKLIGCADGTVVVEASSIPSRRHGRCNPSMGTGI